MKRKAPQHGKKESAEMHTHMEADYGKTDNRVERRQEDSETEPSERILELRGRIKAGFYDSKEVIMKIIEKLLIDIKSPK